MKPFYINNCATVDLLFKQSLVQGKGSEKDQDIILVLCMDQKSQTPDPDIWIWICVEKGWNRQTFIYCFRENMK